MFLDLLAKELQPQNIVIDLVPEINISDGLKNKIQTMLEQEEDNYAKVYDSTSIVQTDRNYVFFSNHWLYLAVICKRYAEALYTYCEFFDENIRSNSVVTTALVKKQYDNEALINLFDSDTDKERMIKFIEADATYRPGKALINLTNGNVRIRTTKDILGSCVLKKIPVPDASSAYLGNLIYYLAKNHTLYEELSNEITHQLKNSDGVIKLPSLVKDSAKQIIDCIYKIDKFALLSDLLEDLGKNIKIKTDCVQDILPTGNFLRYIFAKPESDLYTPDDSGKPRVFLDKEYEVQIDGIISKCRLTTEWVGSEVTSGALGGNYLKALVAIVNKYYAGLIDIKEELGGYYIYMFKNDLKLKDLPDSFQVDFSRRFITSLLAKPFVILTGNSGTGKTRIAKQFSEYLEKVFEDGSKNYALIPVGADWTDNTKLLGFYNPLANDGTGEYIKTDIVRLIEKANENSNVPYFLILDEMNLSHVERYFSDFLSHMEISGSEFVLDGYPGKLPFPSNLFVVGTVNIDETTYMFSPKVLDRANVVEFKPEKKAVLDLFVNTGNNGKIIAANDGSAEAFYKLAKEIRGGRCDLDSKMESVKEIFESIYELVDRFGFEFAYRTVREIRQYISAAYAISDGESTFDLMRAVDEQLLQKVLPKIHGNRKEIGGLLDEFENLCEEKGLVLSGQKIKQMKGKLATVQYASFI